MVRRERRGERDKQKHSLASLILNRVERPNSGPLGVAHKPTRGIEKISSRADLPMLITKGRLCRWAYFQWNLFTEGGYYWREF